MSKISKYVEQLYILALSLICGGAIGYYFGNLVRIEAATQQELIKENMPYYGEKLICGVIPFSVAHYHISVSDITEDSTQVVGNDGKLYSMSLCGKDHE